MEVKALVWLGPERMEVRELPVPRPGPGEVLVKTEAAGICGSEVEGYLGRMSNRNPPLVMGHEYAGLVTEVGEGVDHLWSHRRVAALGRTIPPGTITTVASGQSAKEYFGMTVGQTFKTWSLLETIISLMGLLLTFALAAVL